MDRDTFSSEPGEMKKRRPSTDRLRELVSDWDKTADEIIAISNAAGIPIERKDVRLRRAILLEHENDDHGVDEVHITFEMAAQAAIDAENPKITERYRRALKSGYSPHLARHYAGVYLLALMWFGVKYHHEPTPKELEQFDREGGWKLLP